MRRVLVVDDEPDLVELLTIVLSRAGFEVWTACDGTSALTTLGDTAFDVALVDVGLPHGSGIEVLTILRSEPGPNQHTPVVLLSAYAAPENVERGLGAGADVYMTKPFKWADLIETLSGLVDRLGPPQPPAHGG